MIAFLNHPQLLFLKRNPGKVEKLSTGILLTFLFQLPVSFFFRPTPLVSSPSVGISRICHERDTISRGHESRARIFPVKGHLNSKITNLEFLKRFRDKRGRRRGWTFSWAGLVINFRKRFAFWTGWNSIPGGWKMMTTKKKKNRLDLLTVSYSALNRVVKLFHEHGVLFFCWDEWWRSGDRWFKPWLERCDVDKAAWRVLLKDGCVDTLKLWKRDFGTRIWIFSTEIIWCLRRK